MARKRRPSRVSKKVYCFIVEGCTEENYIKLLKRIYKKDAKIENCKGGNAKGVLVKAKSIIKKSRDDYSGYVIWFDADKYFPSSDANLKQSLEAKAEVEIYMSEPCAENWLLAHFQTIMPGHEQCSSCEKTLQNHIPNYKKSDCLLLTKYINETRIRTAIVNYPEIGEIPQRYFMTSPG